MGIASSITDVQISRGPDEAHSLYVSAVRGKIDPKIAAVVEV